MMKNPYNNQKAVIDKIIRETDSIKTFCLKPEIPFAYKCGQFAELLVPGAGEAPFAMSNPPYEPEYLQFTIQNTGYMTNKLHKMDEGDILGIRGPYGNGFDLERFYEREILLVIGGVGFPPARALLYSLLAEKDKFKKITMCYGTRTPADIVYKYQIDEFRSEIDLLMTVDKADPGWQENEGVVTVLLDKVEIDPAKAAAVVIGPPVMMKFATLKLLEMNFQAQQIFLSTERKMYCGIGQCRHCMIDSLFICKDGPVFTYEQLENLPDIWE